MAPSLHRLPEELLVYISRELEQSDLCSLSLVSGLFHRLAIAELYRSVKLDAWGPELVQFTVSTLRNPDLANHVESLEICCLGDEKSVNEKRDADKLRDIGLAWPKDPVFKQLLRTAVNATPHGKAYRELEQLSNANPLYMRVRWSIDRDSIISLLLSSMYNVRRLALAVCYQTEDLVELLLAISSRLDAEPEGSHPLGKLDHVALSEMDPDFSAFDLLRRVHCWPTVKSLDCNELASWTYRRWKENEATHDSIERLKVRSLKQHSAQGATTFIRGCKKLKQLTYDDLEDSEGLWPEFGDGIFHPRGLLETLPLHCPELEDLTLCVESGSWGKVGRSITFAPLKFLRRLQIQWAFFSAQDEGWTPFTGSKEDYARLENEIVSRLAATFPSSLRTLVLEGCDHPGLTWLKEALRRRDQCFPRMMGLRIRGSMLSPESNELLQSIKTVAKDAGLRVGLIV